MKTTREMLTEEFKKISEGAPIGNRNAAKDYAGGGKELKTLTSKDVGSRVVVNYKNGRSLGVVNTIRSNGNIEIGFSDGSYSLFDTKQDDVTFTKISKEEYKSLRKDMKSGKL